MKSYVKAATAGASQRRGRCAAGVLSFIAIALGVLASSALAAPLATTIDPVGAVSYQTAQVSGTVDPGGNFVFWSFETSTDGASWSGIFEDGASGSGAQTVTKELKNLVPGTHYFVRLSATNFSDSEGHSSVEEFTTPATTPPSVTIDPPTEITPITGHFSGTISPGSTDPAFNVKWHFECTPACPGPSGEIPADNTTHQVGVDIDLKPGTAYEVSLVAANAGTQASAGPETFSTPASAPPIAITKTANPKVETATLFGSVNPLGLPTTYYFEYGPDTAYGSRVPIDHGAPVGSGYAPVGVEKDVSGLQAGTTYHYRLVAESADGTTAGEDRSFTTLGGAGPLRAYELVSPPDKGNRSVYRDEKFFASEDGNAISYMGGYVVLPGQGTEAAPYLPQYVAKRSASEWSSTPVDLAQGTFSTSFHLRFTVAVSHDGSKALVGSTKALAPGAVEGDSNLYLEDTSTRALTTVLTYPGNRLWGTVMDLPDSSYTHLYAGGNTDFSHVLIYGMSLSEEGTSFLPGVANRALYDFGGGELKVVSYAPDGTTVLPSRPTGRSDHAKVRVSEDGSKIFFESPLDPLFDPFGPSNVYVRVNGTETKAISRSHRASDAGTLQPSKYVGASRDGSVAYIFSQDLTEDSEPGVRYLYRYVVANDELERLSPVGNGANSLQVSEDGGTVYFASESALTGEINRGNSIYVWRNGELSMVASLLSLLVLPAPSGPIAVDQYVDAGQDGLNVKHMWASPNGRYLGFNARTPITDYDTTPAPGSCTGDAIYCTQIYRYDADTHQLDCASCRPDGRAPTSIPHIGNGQDEWKREDLMRITTDNGQVFFDTEEKLVPEDINGVRDVYEFDGSSARLISPGHGRPSRIAAIGGGGDDVFFTTDARLVKLDTDNADDLYDARVGGGIASQDAEPPSANCFGEDCRGLAFAPPAPLPGGSQTTVGPGNADGRAKKRCPKGRHLKKVNGKKRCVKRGAGKARTNNNRRQGR